MTNPSRVRLIISGNINNGPSIWFWSGKSNVRVFTIICNLIYRVFLIGTDSYAMLGGKIEPYIHPDIVNVNEEDYDYNEEASKL